MTPPIVHREDRDRTAGEAAVAPARRSKFIPSLDGVRACAVIIVLLGHAHAPHVPGSLGVTIFFFLSGYLITTLLRLEWDETGAVSLRDFYLRRFLRILPPLWITLAAILILNATGAIPGALHALGILASAAYFANYWQVFGHASTLPRGSGIFWSVGVEEHFYVLFPIVYIWFRARALSAGTQCALLVGFCAAVLAWRFVLLYGVGARPEWLVYGSDARIDSLLFGCLLAVCGNPYLTRMPGPPWFWTTIALPVALVNLVGVEFTSHHFAYTVGYTIQGIALIPVFIAIVAFPRSWAARILNLRPVAYVGVLSYCMYLTHRLFQIPLQSRLNWSWERVAVLSFVGAVIVSWAMHETIEKPAARLRRRLDHVRPPPTALVTAPSSASTS